MLDILTTAYETVLGFWKKEELAVTPDYSSPFFSEDGLYKELQEREQLIAQDPTINPDNKQVSFLKELLEKELLTESEVEQLSANQVSLFAQNPSLVEEFKSGHLLKDKFLTMNCAEVSDSLSEPVTKLCQLQQQTNVTEEEFNQAFNVSTISRYKPHVLISREDGFIFKVDSRNKSALYSQLHTANISQAFYGYLHVEGKRYSVFEYLPDLKLVKDIQIKLEKAKNSEEIEKNVVATHHIMQSAREFVYQANWHKIEFQDMHSSNVGLMPDGKFKIIDCDLCFFSHDRQNDLERSNRINFYFKLYVDDRAFHGLLATCSRLGGKVSQNSDDLIDLSCEKLSSQENEILGSFSNGYWNEEMTAYTVNLASTRLVRFGFHSPMNYCNNVEELKRNLILPFITEEEIMRDTPRDFDYRKIYKRICQDIREKKVEKIFERLPEARPLALREEEQACTETECTREDSTLASNERALVDLALDALKEGSRTGALLSVRELSLYLMEKLNVNKMKAAVIAYSTYYGFLFYGALMTQGAMDDEQEKPTQQKLFEAASSTAMVFCLDMSSQLFSQANRLLKASGYDRLASSAGWLTSAARCSFFGLQLHNSPQKLVSIGASFFTNRATTYVGKAVIDFCCPESQEKNLKTSVA